MDPVKDQNYQQAPPQHNYAPGNYPPNLQYPPLGYPENQQNPNQQYPPQNQYPQQNYVPPPPMVNPNVVIISNLLKIIKLRNLLILVCVRHENESYTKNSRTSAL